MGHRILVIGLDGATPELLFKWAEEGKLPNINKLIKSGVSGKLRSTTPPMTAPAWTSFATGKNPGKHGIYHFVQHDRRDYKPKVIGSTDVRAVPIWTMLSELDKKVGLVQVPMTYPPTEVNGFMISGGLGVPGPQSNFTYPPELRETLINDLDFRIINEQQYNDENAKNYFQDLMETEQKKGEVTVHLMKTYEWDFFMVVFAGVDPLQHFFWKYMDPTHPGYDPEKFKDFGDCILLFYQLLDRIVGDMLENIDNNTDVVIMSDHGFGPCHKLLFLNNWFMDNGLLKINEGRGISFGNKLMSRFFFTREMITMLISSLGLKGFIKYIPRRAREALPSQYAPVKVDWSKTKAYSFATHGLIYINVRGREPNGIVEPGREYEELRDYIIRGIESMEDPEDGSQIVEKVFKKEELYHGEFTENAPDLFVLPYMTYHNVGGLSDSLVKVGWKIGDRRTSFFLSKIKRHLPTLSGSHRMDGIFIISGPDVKKGKSVNAEITDLTPTILYSMGIPVPNDMDGKVLKNIFSESFSNANPIL